MGTFIFFNVSLVQSQVLNFEWANTSGAPVDHDWIGGISFTFDNHVVLAGTYSGTADFDYGAGVDNRTSIGYNDCFVQKLDPMGNVSWTATFGGNFTDYITWADTDENSNTYSTGLFNGTVDFDPGPGVSNLIHPGNAVFVQKLDENGELVWAINLTGSAETSIIKVDSDQNIILAGYFSDIVDFDPSAAVATLSSPGVSNGFIAKYDSDGNFIWVKQLVASSYVYITGIDSDSEGNYYAGGYFEGTVDMDPSPTVFNLSSSPGEATSYVAKYNSEGELIWAKNFLGTSNYTFSLSADPQGNTYSTGEFYGTVDFDPGIDNTNTMSVYSDLFLLKLDKDGNFQWVNSIGGTDAYVFGNRAIADNQGNVYFTGSLQGTADFDAGIPTYDLASSGGGAIFFGKVTAGGEFIYAYSNNGDNQGAGTFIDLDNQGNLYLAGTFQGTVDFDPFAPVYSATSTGYDDFFIQKYSCDVDLTITNESGTFTSNQIGGTYQWIDCETNLPIVGATSQSYTPISNGQYAVQVTNGQCSGTSACISIADVGIPTNSLSNLTVFPNPTQDRVTVLSETFITLIQIMDMNGKLVDEFYPLTENPVIDLNGYPAGIYYLQVFDENLNITHVKIIKN